jgi:hypothetical protein
LEGTAHVDGFIQPPSRQVHRVGRAIEQLDPFLRRLAERQRRRQALVPREQFSSEVHVAAAGQHLMHLDGEGVQAGHEAAAGIVTGPV